MFSAHEEEQKSAAVTDDAQLRILRTDTLLALAPGQRLQDGGAW